MIQHLTLCLLWLGCPLAAYGQAASSDAPMVKVTRDALGDGRISPLQYGQFVEYLCDLVPAMWSEKLYDGSFEGLTPYAFVYLKEKDFKEQPWYPSGATNRALYSSDRESKVSGEASQKIEAEQGAPSTVGLSQDGIFVDGDVPCVFKCFLRGQSLSGPVRVTLHQQGKALASCEFEPSGEWKPYTARLISTERAENATLSVQFRGPGTLWLDNASLMPEQTVGGWRPDVVEAVRALKPGVIRFGGSAVDPGEFEWKETVGDADRRKPFRAWGGLQPTGPGLEEFVQFCRAVDAEPLICVRFNKRTPQDAAEQVEYFNGSVDTPAGAQRSRNGHPQPYAIKYWQVGNEVASAEYDEKLASFCQAMKKVDPSIKLLSSYPAPKLLENAGSILDHVAPHHYSTDLAGLERNIADIRQMIRTHAANRPIKIAVTEWNTTAGDPGPRRAMLWTLQNALACSKYHHLLHRNSDIVEIANRSNLANSFCSGIIQTDTHRLYKTPTYYAQQLYATLAGERALKIDPAGADAAIDLSATLSHDGKTLVLFAVNDTLKQVSQRLDLSSFGDKGQELSLWTLADRDRAGEPDVTNGFSDPQRIAARESKIKVESGRFNYDFPALSLTVLKWKIE